MLPPLQEEYFFDEFPLWSVDIKVLKYFICPQSEFKSICPRTLSHFQYQFNKSLFIECRRCTRNPGWYITGNISLKHYYNLVKQVFSVFYR